MDKMHFTRMDQGTVADFEVMKKVHEKYASQFTKSAVCPVGQSC
jgi:hypothetical protein